MHFNNFLCKVYFFLFFVGWCNSKNSTVLFMMCGVKTLAYAKLLVNYAIVGFLLGFSFFPSKPTGRLCGSPRDIAQIL